MEKGASEACAGGGEERSSRHCPIRRPHPSSETPFLQAKWIVSRPCLDTMNFCLWIFRECCVLAFFLGIRMMTSIGSLFSCSREHAHFFEGGGGRYGAMARLKV